MAITALNCSTKHHVHPCLFTNTCKLYTDPELKQTLAMTCYEAHITLVRATVNYISRSPQLRLAHYIEAFICLALYSIL